MIALKCPHCNLIRQIEHQGADHRDQETGEYRFDKFNITLTCCKCVKRSAFEVEQNAVTFNVGALFDKLTTDVDNDAKIMFEEALLCFNGASFKGTVAMCRSAIEQALEAKNVKGVDLYRKIESAQKKGLLGDIQVSQAHAARLAGREVLHQMAYIKLTEGILALTATIELLNHIGHQNSE